MQKILILFFFLTFGLFAQTKYFLPIPLQQSNGRPINGANVDLYTAGTSTKVYDLTYSDNSPGLYYNTSAFAESVYDVYINGNKTYANVPLGGTVSTADVAGLITDFANDSLTASNGVVYSGRNFALTLQFEQFENREYLEYGSPFGNIFSATVLLNNLKPTCVLLTLILNNNLTTHKKHTLNIFLIIGLVSSFLYGIIIS